MSEIVPSTFQEVLRRIEHQLEFRGPNGRGRLQITLEREAAEVLLSAIAERERFVRMAIEAIERKSSTAPVVEVLRMAVQA